MSRTALLLVLLLFAPPDDREKLFDAGFDSIEEDDLQADLEVLAGPLAEGRDSPSVGLDLAAEHVAKRLRDAGFTGLGEEGEFQLPFGRELPAPDAENCMLQLPLGSARPGLPTGLDTEYDMEFRLGFDYVPVWRTEGRARGEIVLLGFGIDSDNERFDEITGDLDGKIALIVSGEPRHKRKFEGPEESEDADLYNKLGKLREAGLSGVLVVRREPEGYESLWGAAPGGVPTGGHPRGPGRSPPSPAGPGATGDPDQEPPPHTEPFGFRHTWASWNDGEPPIDPPTDNIPTLEITPLAAARLVGHDVVARLAEVEKKVKPLKPEFTGIEVELASAVKTTKVSIPNVVGVLKGSDPALADEYVVLGAHYDHVGVDSRGRIGFGADDNASGTAALLEIAEAFAAAKPRRSILACAFAGEEDGLLGSDYFAGNSPVPLESMVAMINMDMIGNGDPKEVAVIGVPENPTFEKLLDRAEKLERTKIKKITTGQGQEVFKRSDHYSFHKRGVPVLFFFEGLPIGRNPHYHTWRDTLEEVDVDKVARTTRLVFNTAWLLSEDDERPPPPEHTR